ncbi:family 43 glycosylhydrolase [Pseudonocardia phyllosphaerae]|uniref:family 43 glycosylhydrolase n=1 Tax=Pseudonocardia phyllosphaerae TaxID=3390502 RepID=UPI00397AC1EA
MPRSRRLTQLAPTVAAVAALVLTAGAAQAATGDPARPFGGRAVDGYYADPAITVVGNTYYVYPTTDGEGARDASFTAWSSTDLVHWRKHGPVLSLGKGKDVTWASRNAWAPAMAAANGKFYLYYAADEKIGVAVGDSPVGPFRDIGKPLVTANPGGVGVPIDPAVVRAPDGTRWLYWGNQQANAVPLNKDMVSFDRSKIRVLKGLKNFSEGLDVVLRKGTYHVTYSIGDFRDPDYKVGYATAPTPTGPFTYHGVLLSQDPKQKIRGTGHGSMLQVPGTDEWYYAYHRWTVPNGNAYHREVTIDRARIGKKGLFGRIAPTLSGPSPRPVPPLA